MERLEQKWSGLGSAAAGIAQAFLASRRLQELPDEVFQLGAVWSACERCVAECDAASADGLYRLLTGFAGGADQRAGGAFWRGAAAHYLGILASLLSRWDAAAAHFEDALRTGAATGAVLEVRRTQLAYIRLLLARGAPGDDGKAEHLLAELIASLHLTRPIGALTVEVDGRRNRSASLSLPAAAPPASRYLFRREGDYWTISSGGPVSRLRSLRGLEYIAELLRHPHEQIYVVDLMALGVPGEQRLTADEVAEHGLRVSAESGSVPMLDRRARENYRARWHELLAEEAEARHDNDVGRAGRIQREIDMLAAQLAAAGGRRDRGGPSLKERARVNVRNCITGALRAVRQHDEPLWRHLANAIKTGSFCCYAPDRPVIWEM